MNVNSVNTIFRSCSVVPQCEKYLLTKITKHIQNVKV